MGGDEGGNSCAQSMHQPFFSYQIPESATDLPIAPLIVEVYDNVFVIRRNSALHVSFAVNLMAM